MRGIMSTAMLASLLVVACAKKDKPAEAPLEPDKGASRIALEETVQSAPGKDPEKAQLVIADSIRDACGIEDVRAFFAYDSAAISPDTEAVLKQLAECFATGPLKGRSMLLVGHADPRGSEEYNLVLGSSRAESVKKTLGMFQLSQEKVTTSSRGEMDARGTNEETWVADRKVEVMLQE